MKLTTVAVFLAVLSLLLKASEYTRSSFSNTYVKSQSITVSCDISMDSSSNKITMTLVGPSNVWYGVGFGNTEMSGTYSIIVYSTGYVEERYLIGTTPGNLLDSTFTLTSMYTAGSTRTVVLVRDLDYHLPSSYHYEFSVHDSTLETIYGYGTTAGLEYHGTDKRGSATLSVVQSYSNYKNPITNGMSTNKQHGRMLSITILVSCFVIISIILFVAYRHKNQNNGYVSIDNSDHNDFISIDDSTQSKIMDTFGNTYDENDRLVVV